MNSLFYIFLLFIINFLNAVTFVSLGDSCLPSLALRAAGLRFNAYPFDWIISPHRSIIHNLSTDFLYFLEPSFLRIDPKWNAAVLNNYSGVRFAHDFPIKGLKNKIILGPTNDEQGHTGVIHPNYLKFVNLVKKKYTRRIQRLNELIASGESLIFIRHVTSLQESQALGIVDQEKNNYCDIIAQACEIREVLTAIIPHKNWTLVMLGNFEILKQVCNEEHIKTFYIATENFFPPQWNTTSPLWHSILKQLWEERSV